MKITFKKGAVDPLNIITAIIALLGAVLIIINKGDYGLIALIIATLFDAMRRVI
jgi:hypothetical protein